MKESDYIRCHDHAHIQGAQELVSKVLTQAKGLNKVKQLLHSIEQDLSGTTGYGVPASAGPGHQPSTPNHQP